MAQAMKRLRREKRWKEFCKLRADYKRKHHLEAEEAFYKALSFFPPLLLPQPDKPEVLSNRQVTEQERTWKKKHEEQIKKAQKKKKQLKKITDRDEHITGGMEEYHSRDEHDPKDPWFMADSGTVWSSALNRWVDPAKLQAKHVPPVHVPVPAIKPKRIVPVPHHEQQHLDPSDVKYAESHPDFVAIPRLSWDEDAVARMEGRPVLSSHVGVQKPSHEPDPAPVSYTHLTLPTILLV